MALKTALLSEEEVDSLLRMRFERGWVIFSLPNVDTPLHKLVAEIEHRFFRPGTRRNRYFEVVLGPFGSVAMFDLQKVPENRVPRLVELIESYGIEGVERIIINARRTRCGVWFSVRVWFDVVSGEPAEVEVEAAVRNTAI